jgi:hypothetical protein
MHFGVFGSTKYSNLNSWLVMALHEMVVDYKGYGKKPLYILATKSDVVSVHLRTAKDFAAFFY